MFKVGDMVWLNDDKKYAKITKVDDITFSEKVAYDIEIKNDSYKGWRFDCQLHQTAQAMFEALGYMPYTLCQNDELIGYQWQDKETFNDYRTRNIMFYKDKTWNIFQDHISKAIVFNRPTIEEHNAIHQQMVELGYIEL
jgi:hypothetical protein